MKLWLVVVALAVNAGPVQAQSASEDSNPAAERAGDMLQVGIPLVALGLTFLFDNEEESDKTKSSFAGHGLALDTDWLRMNGSPRHDLMLAVGRTELATYSLKFSINAERPNGGGQSFPSGHTSMAFAGAEFIRKEYGGWWGVPAYLAAGYVGWSRVETKNHWTSDVLAGAAIGIFSNHDVLNFTIPFGQLSVAPTLMMTPNFMNSTAFDPPDSMTREMLNAAPAGLAPGLHFELRF